MKTNTENLIELLEKSNKKKTDKIKDLIGELTANNKIIARLKDGE